MKHKFNHYYWLILSAVVVLLDQFSKEWVLHHLAPGEPMRLLPFFNFTLVFNRGAAFGMLNQAAGWQQWFFGGVAISVSLFILVYLFRLPKDRKHIACALALIFGGAIGNLIDRIRFGFVVDFCDFHLSSWHFAIFNIADSAVTIGAVLLIYYSCFRSNGLVAEKV